MSQMKERKMENVGYDATVSLVTDQIMCEVIRARELHAPMNSLHEAYAVILEEMDEFWEQVKINPKKLSQERQQGRRWDMRKELIQVAAMTVRAILDCDLRAPGQAAETSRVGTP